MLNPGPFAPYFGFTEEEVKKLCEKYNVDYGETQRWYDGYVLDGIHIYNPQAVADLMDSGVFRSYWTGTETYEALKAYIDLNFDGLKEAVIGMLGNAPCRIDPSTCQNDMTTFRTRDDVLTLLLHLGYLTFDEKRSEVSIPNQEIAQEFLRSVKTGGWDGLMFCYKALKEFDYDEQRALEYLRSDVWKSHIFMRHQGSSGPCQKNRVRKNKRSDSMSVAIYDAGCRNEISKIYIPVASEKTFHSVWETALQQLQIRRLGNGVWLLRNDLAGILEDLQRIREWSKRLEEEETAAYLEKRTDFILQELPEKWEEYLEMERLWMG